MASVTVTGNQTIPSSLYGPDFTVLQNALTSLAGDYTSSNTFVDKSPTVAPQVGLNIYEIDSKTVSTFVSPNLAGAVNEVLVLGQKAVSITGGSSTRLVAGAGGNDTISLSGGTGTVIGGQGANVVSVSKGTYTMSGESGADAISVADANVNVTNAAWHDTLQIAGHSNVTVSSRNAAPSYIKVTVASGYGTLQMGNGAVSVGSGAAERITAVAQRLDVTHTGTKGLDIVVSSPTGFGLYNISGAAVIHETAAGGYNLNLTGPDTVYLGAGRDTITETGSATVYGGSGLLKYTGGTGNDYIRLGSGPSTVIAGSGSDTIIAQSGASKIVAGSGADYIQVGRGNATITAGSGSDTVVFSKAYGGSQSVINNFVQGQDHIDLKTGGYAKTDIVSVKQAGGSTIIKLDDGTKITLKNFTSPLSNSDFGF